MRSIDDFLKKTCIDKMNAKHKENWIWFAKEIGEELDKGPIYKDVAFTLHDFSNHCYNIYNIISNHMLYKEAFDSPELSSEALYLLNIAVLFHDYSMTRPNFNRLQHSLQSETYFKEFCKAKVSKKKLVQVQIDIIGTIIFAHSNLKQQDVNNRIIDKEITITSKRLDEHTQGDVENEINTRFLAGILRLADELDLTRARLGEGEGQLSFLNKDDQGQMYSLSCWEELLYFDSMKFNNKNELILYLNTDKYYEDSTKSDENIRKILKKVNDSLNLITDSCFINSIRRHIRISTIRSNFENLGINKNSSPVKPAVLQVVNEVDDRSCEDSSIDNDLLNSKVYERKSSTEVSLISKNMSDELDTYVFNKNLLVGGHFNLNNLLCTRDWINSNYVLDCKKMRYKICDEFKNHISSRWGQEELRDTLIVGVEVYGAVIASSIAFDLRLPCAYIIPEKSKEKHSMQDKKFTADKYDKIILFTDVIASGDTVKEIIKANNLLGKVIGIYTVFYRPILNSEEYIDILIKDNDIINKIPKYSLNNKFSIMLFAKQYCPVNSLAERCKKDFICIDCHKLNL